MLHKITPVVLSYQEEPNLARVLKRPAWAERGLLTSDYRLPAFGV
jgi:hypothetical protein